MKNEGKREKKEERWESGKKFVIARIRRCAVCSLSHCRRMRAHFLSLFYLTEPRARAHDTRWLLRSIGLRVFGNTGEHRCTSETWSRSRHRACSYRFRDVGNAQGTLDLGVVMPQKYFLKNRNSILDKRSRLDPENFSRGRL